MFEYNRGSDIKRLMIKHDMSSIEMAATIGYTEVYMQDVIKDNKPLKKVVQWCLWGIDKHVSEGM